MRPRSIVFLAAALAAATATLAGAQERIGVGLSRLSDGNCAVAQQALIGEYSRTSDTLALRGRVHTEPAGSDCRLDSTAYDVRISRYFSVRALDVTVEFAAAEETTAAPYILADEAGHALLRADGNALYGASLPAGSARTVVAAIGVFRLVGGTRFGVLVNLAPIDWAGHPPGRTVRLTWDAGWRGLHAEVAADVGAGHFGRVAAGYRHALGDSALDVGGGVIHRWGLSAVDNGAPLVQQLAASTFLRDGAPQDHSTVFELTVGYRLGD